MRILFLLLALAPSLACAGVLESLDSLSAEYLRGGGNAKALEQLKCFVRKHGGKTFRSQRIADADPELRGRCDNLSLRLQNESAAVIVDLTQLGNRPRFYYFDFRRGRMLFLHTSHGRYGDTPYDNQTVSYNPKRNSVLRAVHFSNQVGSNASSGGFFLTGAEYQGTYGRSMVLHGLERGANENSCERATVMHKSANITDTSTRGMSSGCTMVPVNRIDFLVSTLEEGALFYVYTPAEAALSADTCGRNLLE